MLDVKNMSALVSASWMFSNGSNNTTSEDKEHLQAFGTHGNETVFFLLSSSTYGLCSSKFNYICNCRCLWKLCVHLGTIQVQKLRNATTAFIVNLCVADLLFCGFSMPLSALTFLKETGTMATSYASCFLWLDIPMVQCLLFSVIAITINRYILIVHPTRYREMYKPRNIAIMIGDFLHSGIWIAVNGVSGVLLQDLLGSPPSIREGEERLLDNVSINKTALRRSKQELKVLRMIMVIFITFVLCYVPVIIVKSFKKEDDLPILNIFGYLGFYFSNIINPVIYIVMSNEYKGLFGLAKSPKPSVV
ncbi:g-protein coupled receptor moody [Caerostris extrusa]|uniref:G-protein coupled receptor moody n=1 Tax=Caerostris extrusa TaxID=172846 RepID=A0AAV4UQ01_CAEEX|nr:g-protein coupled receptor moody [Caerostris extrusa]